jgi:hypothetical protein
MRQAFLTRRQANAVSGPGTATKLSVDLPAAEEAYRLSGIRAMLDDVRDALARAAEGGRLLVGGSGDG